MVTGIPICYTLLKMEPVENEIIIESIFSKRRSYL